MSTRDRLLSLQLVFILLGLALSGCGLFSRYKSNQHGVYARSLSQAEKDRINAEGEIRKDIAWGSVSQNSFLKVTLRIMKTDRAHVFKFVEIGEWIEHARLGNDGPYHYHEVRDTAMNDERGNTLSRVVYYKDKSNIYTLGERWTSTVTESSFIRHIKVFDKGTLVRQYDEKQIDFKELKSDRQKTRINIGVRKEYLQSGELASIIHYDDNGVIVKKEKFGEN